MLECTQEVTQLTINERIKKIRSELNLTMDRFGEKIGLKKSAISHMESGKSNPSNQTINLVCKEFNVNKEWLLYEKGEMFLQVNNSILDELKKNYNLTTVDIEILEIFLDLDESDKKTLLSFASWLVESTKNKKNKTTNESQKKEA